jgi:prevent-host-death family protein
MAAYTRNGDGPARAGRLLPYLSRSGLNHHFAKSDQSDITLFGNPFTQARPVDITKDIQPMTTFRNHSAEIMRHLKATRRPVILTVNGKAAAVVQDAEAYQQLLDLAADASAAEGIRQGGEDLRNGRTRPAEAAFDEIRADHGIPR